MEKFTINQAINIQTEHLNQWKEILKPKVYEDLVKYATKDNLLAKDGFGIKRGTTLTTFISNYLVYKNKGVLEAMIN